MRGLLREREMKLLIPYFISGGVMLAAQRCLFVSMWVATMPINLVEQEKNQKAVNSFVPFAIGGIVFSMMFG